MSRVTYCTVYEYTGTGDFLLLGTPEYVLYSTCTVNTVLPVITFLVKLITNNKKLLCTYEYVLSRGVLMCEKSTDSIFLYEGCPISFEYSKCLCNYRKFISFLYLFTILGTI